MAYKTTVLPGHPLLGSTGVVFIGEGELVVWIIVLG